jgi:hypothetical protein
MSGVGEGWKFNSISSAIHTVHLHDEQGMSKCTRKPDPFEDLIFSLFSFSELPAWTIAVDSNDARCFENNEIEKSYF